MSDPKPCAYCGRSLSGERPRRCQYCSAPFMEPKICLAREPERGIPFYYNGFVVWPMYEPRSRTHEYDFWQGADLIERIVVSQSTIQRLFEPGTDIMPFVWQLFTLAQKDEDKVVVETRNARVEPFRYTFLREE